MHVDMRTYHFILLAIANGIINGFLINLLDSSYAVFWVPSLVTLVLLTIVSYYSKNLQARQKLTRALSYLLIAFVLPWAVLLGIATLGGALLGAGLAGVPGF